MFTKHKDFNKSPNVINISQITKPYQTLHIGINAYIHQASSLESLNINSLPHKYRSNIFALPINLY